MQRIYAVFLVIFLFSINIIYGREHKKEGSMQVELKVESPAFKNGGMIPTKYTCDGSDVSPPIAWSGGPDTTKSYAIIADDPDAPVGTWVHWVIYNIPSDVTELEENVPKVERLPNGALQGINDFRRYGYGGPCPPGGTHRYYFKVYALDTVLSDGPGLTKKKLLKRMEGHIIGYGELMGRYSR